MFFVIPIHFRTYTKHFCRFLSSFWSSAEQRWFRENQRWTALKQRWSALVFLNHSETALIRAEIYKISETALFSADLLWAFNPGGWILGANQRWTTLFQRFYNRRAVQRRFSLNQRYSALDQIELENRRKCFLSVWECIRITENTWFWSVPAMKKLFSAKISSKVRFGLPAFFFILHNCTWPVWQENNWNTRFWAKTGLIKWEIHVNPGMFSDVLKKIKTDWSCFRGLQRSSALFQRKISAVQLCFI